MRAEQKLEFSLWPRLTRSQDLPYFRSISFWSSSLLGSILEVTEEVVGCDSLQGEKVLQALSGCVFSCLVRFDSLQPHGLQPTRLLCPWNFSGKNTGMGFPFLLQGIFLTQGSNSCFLNLLHWQADSLPLCHLGSPIFFVQCQINTNKSLHPNSLPLHAREVIKCLSDLFKCYSYWLLGKVPSALMELRKHLGCFSNKAKNPCHRTICLTSCTECVN